MSSTTGSTESGPPRGPGGRRVGAVALLRRFPLRSAGGELPRAARVGPGGLEGDRRWSLAGPDGEPLTGRRAPAGLAGLAAAVEAGDLVLDLGGRRLRGPERDAALADLAGTPVRLVDAEAAGAAAHREGAAVHLVSDGAADAPDAPAGCEPGERANAVLALDRAVARPGDERGWVGARLRVGGALLAVTRTPRACLGVYADVLEPGEVRVGDPVVLLPAPPVGGAR